MPTDYFSKCTPLLRTDFDTCGGLTLCNVAPVTDDQLDSIFQDSSGRFRAISTLLEADMMGKACQIQENPLYNWIIANAEDYSKSLNPRGRRGSDILEVEPFLKVRRKGIINNLFWSVTNAVNATQSVNGAIADARFDLTSQTSIPADPNWFAPGDEIMISGKSAAGLATRTNWKVVFSVVSGSAVRVYVQSRNAGSALPSGKLEFPTAGVAISLANNTSPYESRCVNIPRLNPTSDYLIWIQSTRWSICNDQKTRQFRQYLLDNNPLYREYYHTSEAEYNKSVMTHFQNTVAHTFLFGKKDANQTETLWPNLPQITSFSDQGFGEYLYLPGIEGRCVGRKAYTQGVYEQLAECGRVIDLQGDVLNWPELQDYLYTMYRIRKSNGLQSKIIEVVTDSAYRQVFVRGLYQYLRSQYSGDLRVNAAFPAFPKAERTPLGFLFQDFELDYPAGVILRVVSHEAFDDMVNAHTRESATLTNVGRWLLILAWDTITMGVLESRTKDLSSGNIDTLAAINGDAFCRMEVPVRDIRHYLATWTVDVSCPAASLWLENINFGEVEAESKYAVYTDVRGNNPANDPA